MSSTRRQSARRSKPSAVVREAGAATSASSISVSFGEDAKPQRVSSRKTKKKTGVGNNNSTSLKRHTKAQLITMVSQLQAQLHNSVGGGNSADLIIEATQEMKTLRTAHEMEVMALRGAHATEIKVQRDASNEKVSALQASLDASNKKVVEMLEEIDNLQNELGALSADDPRVPLAKLEAELQNEREDYRKTVTAHNDAVTEHKRVVQSLREQLVESKEQLECHTQSRGALQAELDEVQTLAAQWKAVAQEQKKSLEVTEHNLATLERSSAILKDDAATLRTEIALAKEEGDLLRSQMEAQEAQDATASSIHQQEVSALQAQVVDLQAKLTSASGDMEALQKEMEENTAAVAEAKHAGQRVAAAVERAAAATARAQELDGIVKQQTSELHGFKALARRITPPRSKSGPAEEVAKLQETIRKLQVAGSQARVAAAARAKAHSKAIAALEDKHLTSAAEVAAASAKALKAAKARSAAVQKKLEDVLAGYVPQGDLTKTREALEASSLEASGLRALLEESQSQLLAVKKAAHKVEVEAAKVNAVARREKVAARKAAARAAERAAAAEAASKLAEIVDAAAGAEAGVEAGAEASGVTSSTVHPAVLAMRAATNATKIALPSSPPAKPSRPTLSDITQRVLNVKSAVGTLQTTAQKDFTAPRVARPFGNSIPLARRGRRWT